MEDRILAIVPARGGSKGIPRKNLATVAGQSLIARAVHAGRDAGLQVFLTTDDQEMREAGIAAGAMAPFLRPDNLASDSASSIHVLQHAIAWYEAETGHPLDMIVALQPTSPLRTAEDVRAAVAAFRDRPDGTRSLISVSQASHLNLSILYRQDEDGCGVQVAPPTGMSRQAEPQFLIRNGAVYIAERDMVVTQTRVICDRPLLYRMPRWRGVNIDDYFELYLAQVLGEHPPSGAAAEA